MAYYQLESMGYVNTGAEPVDDAWNGIRTGNPADDPDDGVVTPSRLYMGIDANSSKASTTHDLLPVGASRPGYFRSEQSVMEEAGTTGMFEDLNEGTLGGPYADDDIDRKYEVGVQLTTLYDDEEEDEFWYWLFSAVTAVSQDPEFNTSVDGSITTITVTMNEGEAASIAKKYHNNSSTATSLDSLDDFTTLIELTGEVVASSLITPTFKKIKYAKITEPIFASIEGTVSTETTAVSDLTAFDADY